MGEAAIFLNKNTKKHQMLAPSIALSPTTTLFALGGSVLDYEGGAIVNAANEGGVSGFGLDEMVNRAAGGFEIMQARKQFGGIPTGSAKSTPSFQHEKVEHIIHAVGPVFRENSLTTNAIPIEAKYKQLSLAYYAAMEEATQLDCSDVGFCLLSAGVFRGEVPLEKIIGLGIEGIEAFVKGNDSKDGNQQKPLSKYISLVAFTKEEQNTLAKVFDDLHKQMEH
mmetsp:Transcript_22748/g.33595  ORF Transcript_22748/g.33595 Transcript_22748/m.33595 type:complete len:223 (+) Transcript_22748:51-719(+)